MKKLSTIVLSLCLIVIPICAQTNPPTNSAPQFVFGAGGTFSPYSTADTLTGKSSLLGTFGVRISTSNFYSWSSMQMVPGVKTGAIVSTGGAYGVYQSGRFTLFAIGQAGLSVGSQVTLGTFSGGGLATYQIGPEADKLYLTGGMTVTGVSGNTVQPSFGLGVMKGF